MKFKNKYVYEFFMKNILGDIIIFLLIKNECDAQKYVFANKTKQKKQNKKNNQFLKYK
jgi:hypothetical protein